jgi:hypothetical protein
MSLFLVNASVSFVLWRSLTIRSVRRSSGFVLLGYLEAIHPGV